MIRAVFKLLGPPARVSRSDHLQDRTCAMPETGSDAAPLGLRIVIGILIFLFFELGYQWAARDHSLEAVFFGNTAWDGAIPLVPVMIVPYMLGYVFVLLPMVLLRRNSDFQWGTVIFSLGLVAAFGIFKHWPVYMEKTYATGSDFFARLTRFQQKSDTSLNNCPSLHVALNLYCWMLLQQIYGRRVWAFLPIPLLIVLSTMMVKQHLIIDVVGGLILGGAMGAVFGALRRHGRAGAVAFGIVSVLLVVFAVWNARQLGRVLGIVLTYGRQAGWLGALLLLFVGAAVWLIGTRDAKAWHRPHSPAQPAPAAPSGPRATG